MSTATVRKGSVIGLITGLLFCMWITVAHRADGGASSAGRGLSYPGMMATYLVVSTLAGTIIGAAARYADSTTGTYGIGSVASVPIVTGILVENAGPPTRWGTEQRMLGPVLRVIGTLVIGSEIQRRSKTRTRTG